MQNEHYADAPWKWSLSADGTPTQHMVDTWQLYLRSLYWSFMTLTTTGHVDIIERQGREWEVLSALAITFLATFICKLLRRF